jgi:lysophospholipase L1-like esterase
MQPRSDLKSLGTNLALTGLSVALLLAVIEITLRLTGFSYVLYPEEIEFGRPDPEMIKTGFLEDEDLFWVTPDYPQKLAEMQHRPSALIFMGDSCTQLGNYDEDLAALFEDHRGRRLSYANFGVAGWSSHQGRRQLERDILGLQPQVITVYYGWNDHWIGFGLEDKTVSRVKRLFSSRFSDVRLVQLATKATVAWKARKTGYPNRVSTEDFKENLRSIVRQARAQDIHPMLLTAPTSIRSGEEPEYLTTRWLRDLSELVPLHQKYVNAVREVAASTEAEICDLERSFGQLPIDDLKRMFLSDGIHLSPEGDRHLAELLYACLDRAGLLKAIEGDRLSSP